MYYCINWKLFSVFVCRNFSLLFYHSQLYEKGRQKDIHSTVINPWEDLTNAKKYVLNTDWNPSISGSMGIITFQKMFSNDNFNFAISIETQDGVTIQSITNDYMKGKSNTILERVKWIYLKRVKVADIFNLIKIREFIEFVSRKESAKGFINDKENKYIVFCGEKKEPLLIDLTNRGSERYAGRIILSNIIKINADSFFARNKGIIDVDELSNKRVTIFGVGSLGSIIVEQLCRAGVHNFNLFDYDIYLPNNVSRHTLITDDLFLNKADAIAKRIKSINPFATVNSFGFLKNPFNMDEFYTDYQNVFINSDLIICSTGDEESEFELNYLLKTISHKKSVPTIYAAILGNGFGGRFHKVIFNHTPCYECIKLLQRDKPDIYKLYNEEVYEQMNEENYGVYSQPGIPGLHVDISIIASICTKMSLEMLLPKSKQQFSYNSYIWSNKKGWVFQNAFELKEVVFNKLSNCPMCGHGG